eukprot:TRINITY_DN830_c0_g1_i2.p1 TRINITY_DN830_c0_g1~~TRINITY_DN830_c0_g1_i2.p1  ORF type:complete len:123 (-),score=46.14 TRINITY_DN830_c0_g1_i2:317-685(-)
MEPSPPKNETADVPTQLLELVRAMNDPKRTQATRRVAELEKFIADHPERREREMKALKERQEEKKAAEMRRHEAEMERIRQEEQAKLEANQNEMIQIQEQIAALQAQLDMAAGTARLGNNAG